LKAQKVSLFGPADRYLRRQSHQFLGRELWRVLAINDGSDEIRTHRSLDKDAPVSRPVHRSGIISSRAILGGLHHHYVRI